VLVAGIAVCVGVRVGVAVGEDVGVPEGADSGSRQMPRFHIAAYTYWPSDAICAGPLLKVIALSFVHVTPSVEVLKAPPPNPPKGYEEWL
jgi:hypothetical protein